MNAKSSAALSACALVLCFDSAAHAAPPTVQSTAKQAAKTLNKTMKTASRAGRKVAKTVKRTGSKVVTTGATTAKKLATAPSWATLQAAYNYNAGALVDVKEENVANDNAMQLKLSFTGANGKPVDGIFMRPKEEGTYACALLPHGLTNNKEIAIKMFGNALVAKGIAVLALDAPEHGKAHTQGKNYWSQDVITIAAHEGDRNYRIALDYLATRPDIDMSHIGLVGYSLGSIMGSILGGVDNRVVAFAFCVGGDPFLPIAHGTLNDNARAAIYRVSPSLFIGHIAPRPIIMFNGKKDAVVVPPAAMILQSAAQNPKEVVWYDGGHDVPESIRTRAVEWMTKQLKGEASGAPENEKKDTPPPDAKPQP